MKNYQPRKSGPGRSPTYFLREDGKLKIDPSTKKGIVVNPSLEPSGTKLARKAFKQTIGKCHP